MANAAVGVNLVIGRDPGAKIATNDAYQQPVKADLGLIVKYNAIEIKGFGMRKVR